MFRYYTQCNLYLILQCLNMKFKMKKKLPFIYRNCDMNMKKYMKIKKKFDLCRKNPVLLEIILSESLLSLGHNYKYFITIL